METKVAVFCGKVCWKVRYNKNMQMIEGFSTFRRFYNVKIFNTLRFDYYGESLFKVVIIKENAVECVYPKTKVREFKKCKKPDLWKPEECVFGMSTIEYEKKLSLWGLTAYRNIEEEMAMTVSNSDVDRYNEKVVRYIVHVLYLHFG